MIIIIIIIIVVVVIRSLPQFVTYHPPLDGLAAYAKQLSYVLHFEAMQQICFCHIERDVDGWSSPLRHHRIKSLKGCEQVSQGNFVYIGVCDGRVCRQALQNLLNSVMRIRFRNCI